MQCGHCLVQFHATDEKKYIGEDSEGDWAIYANLCPNCRKYTLRLLRGTALLAPGNHFIEISKIASITLIRPKGITRPICPSEVPPAIAEDYTEACLVLSDSPKASAALSRRCLQNLLRDVAGVKHSDLSKEIQEVIDKGALPSNLAEAIDAIRNNGNFAAHPMKSQSTGEIVPVEPQEAEWNLEVLEELFDHYYVKPAKIAAKRAALDAKLADAGKPPLK